MMRSLPASATFRPLPGARCIDAARRVRLVATTATSDVTYSRDRSNAPRFVQHKNEAKAFYAFLAQVYDYVVNPGHWTVDMRTEALEPAQLNSPELKVVDVGGGTGFCTQGIVQSVPPQNVTLIDQSPHQLAKARRKADLQGVTIMEVRAGGACQCTHKQPPCAVITVNCCFHPVTGCDPLPSFRLCAGRCRGPPLPHGHV